MVDKTVQAPAVPEDAISDQHDDALDLAEVMRNALTGVEDDNGATQELDIFAELDGDDDEFVDLPADSADQVSATQQYFRITPITGESFDFQGSLGEAFTNWASRHASTPCSLSSLDQDGNEVGLVSSASLDDNSTWKAEYSSPEIEHLATTVLRATDESFFDVEPEELQQELDRAVHQAAAALNIDAGAIKLEDLASVGITDPAEAPVPRIPDPDKGEITAASFAAMGYRLSDLLRQRETDFKAMQLAEARERLGTSAANPDDVPAPEYTDQRSLEHETQIQLEQERQRTLQQLGVHATGAGLVGAIAAAPVMALTALANAAISGGTALTDQLHQYRYNRSMREFQVAMTEASGHVQGLQGVVDEITRKADEGQDRQKLIDAFFAEQDNRLYAESLIGTIRNAASTAQVAMERGIRAGIDPDAVTGGPISALAKFQEQHKKLLEDINIGGRSVYEHFTNTIQNVFNFARDLLARLTGQQHMHSSHSNHDQTGSVNASHAPRMG